MSGHSKWKQIKHKKGAEDAKRSNQFTRLSHAISIAAKTGKGLDIAIDQAKKYNMPKENIDRAIKRGTGELAGAEIISTQYEAYASEGVGIIIQVLTDNKNRAVAEIKALLNKHGGKLASGGAVSYQFEEKGVIELKKDGQTLSGEDLELIIIESGAKDYTVVDDMIYIYTEPKDLSIVKKNLIFKSLKIKDAQIQMNPKNYVQVTKEKKASIIKLLEALEGLDDVEEVFTNADL